MRRRNGVPTALRVAMALGCLAAASGPALSQEGSAAMSAKLEAAGLTPETIQELYRLYGEPRGRGRVGPLAVPDVFGHGSVLTVGKVVQKITNFGVNGNPFTNTNSDPSGQWPGQSGTEYLFFQGIAVGAVNPGISPGDPVSRRRVSSNTEWRPPTLAPEDRIYPAYEGIVNGKRSSNDDGDKNDAEVLEYLRDKVDEDFLDGRDNDGDGSVDEDHSALGHQMYSLVMRDDTEEAIRFTQAEPHVPIGLEIRERAWAYSLAALENFNIMEYQITNVSGHEIDSLYVGLQIDADAGPAVISNYFIDDLDVPTFPSGLFTLKLDEASDDAKEPRLQKNHDPDITNPRPGQALCSQLDLRINGFSFADDNGDEGKTLGIPSLLIFDHTIDPLGVSGPSRVGFRAFRSYGGGEPYTQGGPPRIDQQRFEFMSGRAGGDVSLDPHENIDPETGFINAPGGDQRGDFAAWSSIGPWLNIQPGASIMVTIGFAVQRSKGSNPYTEITQYAADYATMKADSASSPQNYLNRQAELLSAYPALKNAFDAQVAFEGIWEARRDGIASTDWHGRETGIRGAHGASPTYNLQDCRDLDDFDGRFRPVQADEYTWFDFDCNYCTGVWNWLAGQALDPDERWQAGMFHKTWNSSAPPPSPALNTGSDYNYTDNPERVVAAAGDRKISLAWDNSSQTSPDPGEINGQRNVFDFRGYSIYKVSGWTRPVGSPGPSESEWSLVASFTMFDYRGNRGQPIPNNKICKQVEPAGVPGDTVICFPGDSLECPPGSSRANRLPCPPEGRWVFESKFPKVLYPGHVDSSEVRLYRGDLWDRQSGKILAPDRSLACVPWDGVDSCYMFVGSATCQATCGYSVFNVSQPETRARYPVGIYRFEDTEVKNGFIYFYSVTAFDSLCNQHNVDGTCVEGKILITEGRKSAVEAEGVSPQVQTGQKVWVVPNPYKGYQRIAERPSSWDLTPNATDPTGTHIDFLGLPPGEWKIRIYTVSGDLVQEIRSSDAVNESLRGPVSTGGSTYAGYNRQQDTANDGQASWNLISRNGQDVVSGVYMFTVDSSEGIQRGRFVVIR